MRRTNNYSRSKLDKETLVIYTNLFSNTLIYLHPVNIHCNDRDSLKEASLLVSS